MLDGVVAGLTTGLISKLQPGETQTIDIPFKIFYPQFRGFKLDGPEIDTSQIREFALYQYDKTDGPFEMSLISVEAYSDEPALVQSAAF
jgi:hypothetical protein